MGTRHSFAGNAIATTLSANIGSGDTAITVGSTSGWPNTAIGPFVITVDKGLSNEEKMLVSAYSGGSLTIAQRGYDGTVAASHTAGAAVVHTIDATSYALHDQVVNGVGTVTPSTSAVGDAAADGTSILPAAADHAHGREGFGSAIVASAPGDTTASGTAATPARSDHKHAREAWGLQTDIALNPTRAATAVAAVAGTTGRVADAGHTHGTAKLAAFSASPVAVAINGSTTAVLTLQGGSATVDFDTFAGLSGTNYTIPVGGVWRFTAQSAVYGSNTDNCHISILVNGTAKRKGAAVAVATPDYWTLHTELLYEATAGDVITVSITNDNSGAGLQMVTTDETLHGVTGVLCG